MREIRPSGSEGGARFKPLFLPLSPHENAVPCLQVALVALRQARPCRADGMGSAGRPVRRFTRRYSSRRDEFHRMKMRCPACR